MQTGFTKDELNGLLDTSKLYREDTLLRLMFPNHLRIFLQQLRLGYDLTLAEYAALTLDFPSLGSCPLCVSDF